MPLYLVRHGRAGRRDRWDLPDELRPLSEKGRAEARALVDALRDHPVDHVRSSRYVRCLQTVEPLAAARGLDVEHDDALAEETTPEDVVSLVKAVAATNTVLCTHGNVVPWVLDHLRRNGVHFASTPHVWEKGSTWVLDTDRGEVVGARYLPPPA